MGVTIRPHVGSSYNYLLGGGVTAYRGSKLFFYAISLEYQNYFVPLPTVRGEIRTIVRHSLLFHVQPRKPRKLSMV